MAKALMCVGTRRFAWCFLLLAGLAVWQVAYRYEQRRASESRPSTDEVVRMFGGGPSADPNRDELLRNQVVGRWGRSDSDLVFLDFAADGGLRGSDMTSDPAAVAEGKKPFTAREYVGRWEIYNASVRLYKPYHILVYRIRFTEDGRLQLYDMIERIDQAHLYHRFPAQLKQ